MNLELLKIQGGLLSNSTLLVYKRNAEIGYVDYLKVMGSSFQLA